MGRSTIAILVVDDYAPWRRFVSSLLQQQLELQVIGEASDGLEAVQKAKELQPDLILLDIGLPKLNGIEAARRIRDLSPTSKILFVSQQSSVDMVQAALRAGASGYVFKTDAQRELLTAVNTVLRGERFISSRFARHDFTACTDSRGSDHDGRSKLLASSQQTLLRKAEPIGRHEAQFYSADASFLDGFTRFIGNALNCGSAVILVATESHRERLLPRLQAYGLDIADAIERRRLNLLDAADTVSTFMVNDVLDPIRFLDAAGKLITTAAKAAVGEHPRVAICGECDPPLWTLGMGEAAVQLEQLWNKIVTSFDVDILCGYSLQGFRGLQQSDLFQRICAEHSAFYSR